MSKMIQPWAGAMFFGWICFTLIMFGVWAATDNMFVAGSATMGGVWAGTFGAFWGGMKLREWRQK